MDKKIIVANYRFHVTGGPEVYMFKFMEECKSNGLIPIPFSVNYSKNVKTSYSKYFVSSRGGDSIYYNKIKKTPIGVIKTLEGAFFNREAYRNITDLIEQENPKVLYALQVINTLSPSIFKAAKKGGLKVVHRISDFNLLCPRSDMLRNGLPCELCLNGNLKNAIKNKCCHNSKITSIIRCISMEYHRKKRLYDYVDYFVTPTEFTRNLMIKAGFDETKIITIPTFIDATKIQPDFIHYEYLLFLGRMSEEKGYKYAIEALKYLKNSKFKLKITGNIEDLDIEMKTYITNNNLTNRIDFVGFKKGKELNSLISNALVVLCPSIWYDNMPNTVLEAFAYGKPVIASNLGCFPEIITDGIDGYLFKPKSPEDLAYKINELSINSDKCKLMGENGRNKVENKYNMEQHFSKLKKLFFSENMNDK